MTKWTNAVLSLCFLSTLVGCDDVSSNRKQATPDRITPGVEADPSIRSAIHRRRNSAVISYTEEISQTLSGNLSARVYFPVPDMEIDDEGTNNGNIVTRTSLGRPKTTCGAGSGFQSVNARINDCEAKNGTSARWDGYIYGAAGEGSWRLVSLLENGKEIWLDERTNMVWSDLMTVNAQNKFNWCKASGNEQGATVDMIVDCQSLADAESVCHGNQTENIGSQIVWRLPTRNDYLQADLDGLRFALRVINGETLWTATMKAGVAGRNEAWIYNPKEGTLASSLLTNEVYVRCIGVPNLQ